MVSLCGRGFDSHQVHLKYSKQRVFRNLIKSDNRRNLNELRRLPVYKPLYLRVHTDTAETLKILPTGYNMATEKIDFVKL